MYQIHSKDPSWLGVWKIKTKYALAEYQHADALYVYDSVTIVKIEPPLYLNRTFVTNFGDKVIELDPF